MTPVLTYPIHTGPHHRTADATQIPAGWDAASDRGDIAAPSPMPPTPTPTSAPWVPAGPVLTRLASSLSTAPADTTSGRYQYVEGRTWYRDITGPPGPAGWPQRIRVDQLWRTDDAANGRQVSTQISTTGCTPDGSDQSWTGHSGGDRFDQLPPTRAADLRSHLLITAGPDRDRPGHLIGGVAMLYERHAPTRPVRAALLRLLAEQPGLLVQTGVTDRVGRTGIDIALPYTDRSGVPRRDVLTIDPNTGQILAAFTTITGPVPPSDPRMGPHARDAIVAEADGYRLYTDSRRTPDTDTPPAGCQHPAATRCLTSLGGVHVLAAPVGAGRCGRG
ncbi:hypothetical protein [Micromonospora sp. WMMD1082]|uniref:hypothetical protein n=1 Tax=Micromonospora sp. WMMD1082 TaxID=3016104 RepID=UPI002417E912|nr:hypothetical protein [Micromonospora sp. WMMD1082]MDG4793062.1 hypothetical protein [Micromonospora sp. WMMD1082]